MPNIKILSGIPQELFLETRSSIKRITNLLKPQGAEVVFTSLFSRDLVMQRDNILLYGFDNFGEQKEEADYILNRLKQICGVPVQFVDSSCIGIEMGLEKKSPYVQVTCKPKDVEKYFDSLKELRLGYDVEFHPLDCNGHYKNSDIIYAEIILLPTEARLFGVIIDELEKIGLPEEFLWPRIITEVTSGDKMK